MNCWSLLIGARKLRAKSRKFSRADERALQEITATHFPSGFTILKADGAWFDPAKKRMVREESRQILIISARLEEVRQWGKELGRALHQKEVVVIGMGKATTVKISPRTRS